MKPFITLSGPAAPLLLANIDTDVIIRIDRLTAADRTQIGRYVLESLRYGPDGEEDPGFIWNQAPFRGAPILLAGDNFGCGSSREGAVWALQSCGVQCVIAPGFGDIFFGNCFQNGLLAIRLPEADLARLAAAAESGTPMQVDLVAQTLKILDLSVTFDVDTRRKDALLRGLDGINATLEDMATIRAWQREQQARCPWLWHSVHSHTGDRFAHPQQGLHS